PAFRSLVPACIFVLSLHDALPIYGQGALVALLLQRQGVRVGALFQGHQRRLDAAVAGGGVEAGVEIGGLRLGLAWRVTALIDDGDRKSTRLNSSHVKMSYAGFCLE